MLSSKTANSVLLPSTIATLLLGMSAAMPVHATSGADVTCWTGTGCNVGGKTGACFVNSHVGVNNNMCQCNTGNNNIASSDCFISSN
jgi:hypothetical protein